MKKLLALLLVVGFLTALTGCPGTTTTKKVEEPPKKDVKDAK